MKCLIWKEGYSHEYRPCDGVYQAKWYEVDSKMEKELPHLGWFIDFETAEQFEAFLMTHEHLKLDMRMDWIDGKLPIRLLKITKK